MKQHHVQFCDGCGKVRDEMASDQSAPRWIDLRTFEMRYGFKPEDLTLTHTYCPDCKECVQAGTHSAGPPGRSSR